MINTEYESQVTVLTTEDEIVDALSDGDRGNNLRREDSILRYQRWTAGRYTV